MNTSTITIRTAEKDKKAIAKFASSVGMSTSSFANVVLLQAVRQGQVILAPNARPNPEFASTLKRAGADISKGRNLSPVFDNAKDFFDDLDQELNASTKT